MSEVNLFNYQKSLFDKIVDEENLGVAFNAVKRNGGAPGVDGVTIENFEQNLEENLRQLKQEVDVALFC